MSSNLQRERTTLRDVVKLHYKSVADPGLKDSRNQEHYRDPRFTSPRESLFLKNVAKSYRRWSLDRKLEGACCQNFRTKFTKSMIENSENASRVSSECILERSTGQFPVRGVAVLRLLPVDRVADARP